jgi:hypothetical protein
MAYKRWSVRADKILFFLAVIFVSPGLEQALAENTVLNAGFRSAATQKRGGSLGEGFCGG